MLKYESYVDKIHRRAFTPKLTQIIDKIIVVHWDELIKKVEKNLLHDEELRTMFHEKRNGPVMMEKYVEVTLRTVEKYLDHQRYDKREIELVKNVIDSFTDGFMRGYNLAQNKPPK